MLTLLFMLAQEGKIQEPLFQLDATVTMLLVGFLLPVFVGIVTKLTAPSWLKAILHLFLAAISGLIITATTLDGVAFISREALVTAFITWVVGVAAYFGFLIPTGISPAINTATANVGIGGKLVTYRTVEVPPTDR